MGRTHAVSALAAVMAIVTFAPAFGKQLFGVAGGILLVIFSIDLVGSSLIPDLDNTASTAKSSLGLIGDVLSSIIRAISAFVQTTVRTRRDKPDPDPHRGAFHTIPAAALSGFLAWFATRAKMPVTLPLIGHETAGYFFGIFITAIMLHLAIAGIAKPLLKTLSGRSKTSDLLMFGISFLITYLLFTRVHYTNFNWIGMAIFLGCSIHVFGDCFTTMGAPILFPLTVWLKGKFWYNTRFLPIKAGGTIENVIFAPFFMLVTLGCILKLLHVY